MSKKNIIPLGLILLLSSCLRVETEPIMVLNPTATLTAHIKNQKIYATVDLKANPDVLTAGNIPFRFEYEGDLSIFNTKTGNVIDLNSFTGGGISQVYTVSADTATHDRFIVVVSGRVSAFADIGKDSDSSNDKEISTAEFYTEEQFFLTELLSPPAQN
ncbi:MAG: hypothetical protein R2751_10785 [Bacteroidales bacterium]